MTQWHGLFVSTVSQCWVGSGRVVSGATASTSSIVKSNHPMKLTKGTLSVVGGGWRLSSAHILLLCNSAPSSLFHNNRRTLGIKSKFQNISSLLLLFPECHQLCRFNFIARTFLFFPFFCCFVSLCYMLHRSALIGELTPLLPLSHPNSR